MKFIIYLALICSYVIVALPAYCQLSGKVQDNTYQPLPFANVLLLTSLDSSLVKGVITNDEGQFTIPPVPVGNYLLAISMVGYQPHYASVNIYSRKALDLGTLVIQPSAQELESVVIRGQKPLYEQKTDRIVVHVQNSITSAGGTALDILERSPGVAVNRQNGTIALNGKDGVQVMINGKLSRMPVSAVVEMLRGMNGSNIRTVELIANPPASYDAEGAGGLINIVLQKNTDSGTNGAITLTAGYGYGEKAGSSLTLNSRIKKLNLYGDYSFFRDRTQQLFSISRLFDEPGNQAYTTTESNRRAVITNQNVRVGFDYMLSPNTTLGGLVAGYSNKWQMNALNHTIIQNTSDTSFIRVNNNEINHWRHLMGNLNLAHTFRQGQTFRLDVDYLRYHDNNPSEYLNDFLGEQNELLSSQQAYFRKETPIGIGVLKLDYQQALTKSISWEAGIKGTSSHFVNDVQYKFRQGEAWITDPELTQKHQLQENIAAAYTSWQVQVHSQTRLVAGLRYEYTDTDLRSGNRQSIVKRQYGRFFPNLLISHDFGKERALQFSYGQRITRPTFNDLAPFVIFYGPNNFESGNPALQPSLAHTLKVQYQWKELITSLQYSHENDQIAGYQPHINTTTNELFNYAENLKSAQALTFALLLPLKITSCWQMQHSLIANRHSVTADYLETPEQLTNYNIRLNSTQNFLLPLGLSLEVSGYYQSPFLYGMYEQKATGVLNIGLQKKLSKDASTLSLTWNDVFWTTSWRWDYDRPEQHLLTDATFTMSEPRIVKLTYTYNFGNRKVKSVRNPTTGSEEEQKRVQ